MLSRGGALLDRGDVCKQQTYHYYIQIKSDFARNGQPHQGVVAMGWLTSSWVGRGSPIRITYRPSGIFTAITLAARGAEKD